MSRLPHILILCTGNSCRSHMAEGILQNALGASARVSSAGSDPSGYVHSMAIEVMREIGIDISSHTSEHMDTYLNQEVSVVITVCDHADQACPTFPGNPARYHWPFQDPAKAEGSDEEIIVVFRRVRDQIRLIFDMYGAGFVDGLTSQAASAVSSG